METFDTSVEAVKPPCCSWQRHSKSVDANVWILVVYIPAVIHPEHRTSVVVKRLTDELLRSMYKWMAQFEMPCIVFDGQVRTEWSRCKSSMA